MVVPGVLIRLFTIRRVAIRTTGKGKVGMRVLGTERAQLEITLSTDMPLAVPVEFMRFVDEMKSFEGTSFNHSDCSSKTRTILLLDITGVDLYLLPRLLPPLRDHNIGIAHPQVRPHALSSRDELLFGE